jgi:hypothetical protein
MNGVREEVRISRKHAGYIQEAQLSLFSKTLQSTVLEVGKSLNIG